MAPRYFANSRTRLETLRNNPRLHLIGPTTVAQTRFNNLHTTQSPSSIRHNHLQQKCWRQISDQSNPTGIHQINGTGTALTALLGEGVASLGDVTRPGAWVRAGFLLEDGAEVEVETDTPHGTVRIRVNGLKAEGTVQLSLAAYQALGLSPTTLPVIRVFSAGESDGG